MPDNIFHPHLLVGTGQLEDPRQGHQLVNPRGRVCQHLTELRQSETLNTSKKRGVYNSRDGTGGGWLGGGEGGSGVCLLTAFHAQPSTLPYKSLRSFMDHALREEGREGDTARCILPPSRSSYRHGRLPSGAIEKQVSSPQKKKVSLLNTTSDG